MNTERKLAVVGNAFSLGQGKKGTDIGPREMRNCDLFNALTQEGWEVSDKGDLALDEVPNVENTFQLEDGARAKNLAMVGEACRKIHETAYQALSENNSALFLGGDHSTAMGTISAVLRKYPDACVIWFDAHADINTPFTSFSGNIHGMPVSFLMGLFDYSSYPNFGWLKPCLNPERIAYVGIRDVDEPEEEILEAKNIFSIRMKDIATKGMTECIKEVLAKLDPEQNRPIHVSFDIDGVDPKFAPSTGTAVDEGVAFDDAVTMLKYINETGRLVSLDMVEVNPLLGDKEDARITCESAVKLISTAFRSKQEAS